MNIKIILFVFLLSAIVLLVSCNGVNTGYAFYPSASGSGELPVCDPSVFDPNCICESDTQCPSGFFCRGGLCAPRSCMDTDGGINYNEVGSVTDALGTTFTDGCIGNQQVEYYCEDNVKKEETRTCPDTCTSGSCIMYPVCGNSVCGENEDVNTCPEDCGSGFEDWNDPRRVLIVINENSPESIEVGNYYRQKRGIPIENICQIAIQSSDMASVSPTDTITYSSYRTKVREVVRNCLGNPSVQANNIYYILTTFGVPLKINFDESGIAGDRFANSMALDSALTLVKTDQVGWVGSAYDSRRIKNPYYAGPEGNSLTAFNYYPRPPFSGEYYIQSQPIYLVTRLDGPSLDIVKHMIDKAIMAEHSGVSGNACLDLEGTGFLLDPMVEATVPVIQAYGLPMMIDRSEPVVGNAGSQIVSCGETMAYAGTYNNEGYFPSAFTWVPGSVAVPLHSVNAKYLSLSGHDPNQQEVWVARALEQGMTAAVASAAEPDIDLMVSSIFFDYWFTGYNFASAAYASIPKLGFTVVAIGDPLFHIESLATFCPGGNFNNIACIPGYKCSMNEICTRCIDNDGDGFYGSYEGDEAYCYDSDSHDCNDNDPTVMPNPVTGECGELCFKTNIPGDLGLFRGVWDRLDVSHWVAIDWNYDGVLESFRFATTNARVTCPPPITTMLKVIPGTSESRYSGDVYVNRINSNYLGVCKYTGSALYINQVVFRIELPSRPEATPCES